MKMNKKGVSKKVSTRILSMIMALAITFGMIIASPMKKVNASSNCSNPGTKLVWNTKYSGTLDARGLGVGADNYYRYDFSVDKSGTLSISADIDSLSFGSFMYFYIYDVSNKLVCSVLCQNGHKDLGAYLIAGDYYLTADGIVPGDNCNFSFTSTYEACNETATESIYKKNNTTDTATPYTLGKQYTGYIAHNDYEDYYVFNMKANGFVTYSVDSKLTKHKIEITNTFGDITYKQAGIEMGNAKYKFFLPKGKYYLKVEQDGWVGATYTFNLKYSKLPKVKVKKIRSKMYSKDRSTLTVKFTRNSNVDGYQVMVSPKKNFKAGKKTVTVNMNTANSAIIDSVKRHKTYYVRVRTLKTAPNGKSYYSAWSKVKKIKTK
ncbi:MAG: fibronectin type III domain-containing protein [Eubacterium sp.]|nr:fibronectin type III domain-containing protein [Eubacterium sp.]